MRLAGIERDPDLNGPLDIRGTHLDPSDEAPISPADRGDAWPVGPDRPLAATRLNPLMHWDAADWRPFRPEEAARRFAGLDVPWAVAAGWAIDLFVGRERREHEDLEVAIPGEALPTVAARLPELEWVCRRDERIRLPYDELIEHSADGIPFVRPEVVLLFKAKQARAKDEADLAAAVPLLDTSRRRLLAEWLELVHPGHFWLPDLA